MNDLTLHVCRKIGVQDYIVVSSSNQDVVQRFWLVFVMSGCFVISSKTLSVEKQSEKGNGIFVNEKQEPFTYA